MKEFPQQTAILTGALLLAMTLSSGPAAAQCETQIDQALLESSVPKDDVKSVKVMKQGKGGMSASNYKLDAWIRLKSCSGYLMVSMTRHCVVQQIYTTGDCSVSGPPNH